MQACLLLVAQPFNVRGKIPGTPGVVWIGFGMNSPAADVGIERCPGDTKDRDRFTSRQIPGALLMRNHIDEPQLILRTTLGMNFPLREIYRIVRAMDGEDTIHSNQFIDF
jgi:hypothetical protein